jgi:actin-like ATPase involved in cell morphogenesis
MARKTLGDYLVDINLVAEKQLLAAQSEQGRWGGSLARTLYELRIVDEVALVQAMSKHYNLQLVDLDTCPFDATARAMLDPSFCRDNICLPFAFQEKNKFLDVAVFDPMDMAMLDNIRVATRCNVRPHLANPAMILDALDRREGEPPAARTLQFKMQNMDGGSEEPEEEGEEEMPPLPTMVAVPKGPTQLEAVERRLDEFIERTDRTLRFLIDQLNSLGLLAPVAAPAGLQPLPAVEAPLTLPPEREEPSAVALTFSREDVSTRSAPVMPAQLPDSDELEFQLPPIGQPASTHAPAARAPAGGQADLQSLAAMRATGPHQVVKPAHPQAKPRPPSMEVDVDFDDAAPPPAQPPPERRATGPMPAVDPRAAAQQKTMGPSRVLVSAPARATKQVVAMDFGTTWSAVGAVIDGNVELLRLPSGDWEMPSVVGFRRDGTVMVGHAARKMLASDPTHVISSPKRILGRRYTDPQVAPFVQSMAMESFAGPNGGVVLRVRDKEVTPVEACAHILNVLRLVADRRFNREVHDVLLTTPVSFGRPQYDALREAAALASLNVVDFLDESVAAALSNYTDPAFNGLVAVYDFGGGTFDFAVTEVANGDVKVVATAGDTWLGGDDMDEALAKAACNAFWRQYGIELRNQAFHWQRILVAAELAKRELSTKNESVVYVQNVGQSGATPLDLAVPVTRAQFSELVSDVIRRSLETCQEALELNNLRIEDLSAVYLSGGTCYIPAVQEAVGRFFGKEPRAAVPPERSVLVGAALHGAGLRPE